MGIEAGLRSVPGPRNKLRFIRHRRLSFASKKKAPFVSDLGNKCPIGDSRARTDRVACRLRCSCRDNAETVDDKGETPRLQLELPSAGADGPSARVDSLNF